MSRQLTNGIRQVGHDSSVLLRGRFQPKLVTVPSAGTSWTSFLGSQLNDVMNFVPPFARRVEPGQNYSDHAILDFDHITGFEPRFV